MTNQCKYFPATTTKLFRKKELEKTFIAMIIQKHMNLKEGFK